MPEKLSSCHSERSEKSHEMFRFRLNMTEILSILQWL
jgi:hypothetical protein